MVNFVPAASCTHTIDHFLTEFGSRDKWGVDAVYVKVYPEEHPYHELTKRDTEWRRRFFMEDRQRNPKGLLLIEHGHGSD